MCVYSMVLDHFRPLIPDPDPLHPWWFSKEWREGPKVPDPEKTKKILEDFAKALKAAKKVDELTGQPDCEDPEKLKLLERVKELEALLEKATKKKLRKKAKKARKGRK